MGQVLRWVRYTDTSYIVQTHRPSHWLGQAFQWIKYTELAEWVRHWVHDGETLCGLRGLDRVGQRLSWSSGSDTEWVKWVRDSWSSGSVRWLDTELIVFICQSVYFHFHLLTQQWNRCSGKPSEVSEYSVAEMSSQAGTKRVQTIDVYQFRWESVPLSNYAWKVRLDIGLCWIVVEHSTYYVEIGNDCNDLMVRYSRLWYGTADYG